MMRPLLAAGFLALLPLMLPAQALPPAPVPVVPVAPVAPPAAAPAAAPAPPVSASRLTNADELRRALGLDAYPTANLTGVKIAVLDYGFDGIDGKRPYLPRDTVVVETYDRDFVERNKLGDPAFTKPFAPGNQHGRAMAQIVWGLTGFHPQGPRFYLLNANGPTLFRRAVRYAIEQKVDVILFSGNFEGGGNNDGRGFINACVDQALAAGILWVNSAGNYGGRVYNGPVQHGLGGYVRLGSAPGSTALRFKNLLDENTVTVTLTWNDYKDEEDAGTTKDLDLYVEDDAGRVLASSELRQTAEHNPAGPGETRNPRERVVLPDLAASADRAYRIRVRMRSNNFDVTDRLRILVTASRDAPFRDPATGRLTRPIQFLDASESGEIYPPADHPGVITVGDSTYFSGQGPTLDGRVKPDVVLARSTALFSNGEETSGSSNAAALFAGLACVLKANFPDLRASQMLALARLVDRPSEVTSTSSYRPAPVVNSRFGSVTTDVPRGATGIQPAPGVVLRPVTSTSGSAPDPARYIVLPPQVPGMPSPTVLDPWGRPLSENQVRALRYAEQAARERLARGQRPGGVEISFPFGRFTVEIPSAAARQSAPPVQSAQSLPSPDPVRAAPSTAAEPAPANSATARPAPPHAPWRTPSPTSLAAMLRTLP